MTPQRSRRSPEQGRVRVAVTNTALANTGDAAINQSIRQALVAEIGAEVEVIVFDSSASTTMDLYPAWTIVQQVSQLPRFRPTWLYRVLQYAWTLGLGL